MTRMQLHTDIYECVCVCDKGEIRINDQQTMINKELTQ